MQLIHLSEGMRMFRRRLRVLFKGIKKYKGSSAEICRSIIRDCWNADHQYFQASAGHFCEFWTRDFAWCIMPLIRLGYKEKVLKTLEYAMNIFEKHSQITTTINPKQKPFDFPYYAIDSVPYFIYCLQSADAYALVKKHKDFLNTQIEDFFERVIDEKTGLVRKDRHFSSMKDYAKRKSSCYGNVMAALLRDSINHINKNEKLLDNPLNGYDYKKLIKKHFWTGAYFLDDLSGLKYPTGDANVFPFLYGLFNDKNMLKSCIRTIQQHKLDDPFPLKYTESGSQEHKMISLEFLAPDYERDTIWMHMGSLYIGLVREIDPELANKYISQYAGIIETCRNYPELFKKNKKPYTSLLYHADESMLWAAIYLDIIR